MHLEDVTPCNLNNIGMTLTTEPNVQKCHQNCISAGCKAMEYVVSGGSVSCAIHTELSMGDCTGENAGWTSCAETSSSKLESIKKLSKRPF